MTTPTKRSAKARKHRNDPMTDVILATVAAAVAPYISREAYLVAALDKAEIALRSVPARSLPDQWMQFLQETQIVPALNAIKAARP